MKNGNALLAVGALALTLFGCKPPDTHDADADAIQATETQWVKDFAAKDADKLAAHYTDDATFIVQEESPVTGKSAISAMLKGMVTDPNFTLTFKSSEVDVAKIGGPRLHPGALFHDLDRPQEQAARARPRHLSHGLPQTVRWLMEGSRRHDRLGRCAPARASARGAGEVR